MGSRTPIEVVYDADCNLCRRARSWVERRDADGTIRFASADVDVPAADRVLEVHGDVAGGEGFEGWLLILDRLPRWRRITGLLRTGPMMWLGRRLYGFVAAHRTSV